MIANYEINSLFRLAGIGQSPNLLPGQASIRMRILDTNLRTQRRPRTRCGGVSTRPAYSILL